MTISKWLSEEIGLSTNLGFRAQGCMINSIRERLSFFFLMRRKEEIDSNSKDLTANRSCCCDSDRLLNLAGDLQELTALSLH